MKQSSIHGIDGIDVDILMASTLVEKALKAWKQGGWWRLARPFFFLPEWALVFYLQRKVWRLPGKQWHTKQFHKQKSPQAKERPNSWKQLKWCSVRESRPSLLILQCYVKKKCRGNKAEKFLRRKKRRPIAHTCGATLELSSTYSFYPEFFPQKVARARNFNMSKNLYKKKKKKKKKSHATLLHFLWGQNLS